MEKGAARLSNFINNLPLALVSQGSPVREIWHFGSSANVTNSFNDVDLGIVCVRAKAIPFVARRLQRLFPDAFVQEGCDYVRSPVSQSGHKRFHFVLTSDDAEHRLLPLRASMESGRCLWENKLARDNRQGR